MDFISILTMIMLVVSGGMLFIGVPILVFLLKDRLFFWPRQKWRIQVYESDIRDFPMGQEEPLIGADGKPVYDTQGRPVVNQKTEKRIVILNETPIIDGWCWKIKQKIIPWVWVDRGMLRGFKLDLTFLAYAAPNDKGEKIIRVAQLSKDVWDGGSFYPLGEPDITMLDKRHAIFTHKIDQSTIDQSISAMSASAWDDFKKNRARRDEEGIMKLLQMAAPVFIVVIVLMVAIFAFDFASKSMDKSIGLVDGHLRTCELGAGIQSMPQPVANTTAPSTGIKLPF